MDHISIYTDGSCYGNPGKGGYAAVIREKNHQRIITGGEDYSTNNRMELAGIIAGLSAVRPGSSVTIYTDSYYVTGAVNEGRLSVWQRNGWRRIRTGEPVKNADRWLVLLELMRKRNLRVRFVKVKAHKCNYFNNHADYLARKSAASR